MPNLFKIKQYNLNPGTRRTFRSGSRYHIIFVLRGICQFLETGYSSCCPSDIIFLKPGQTREILASSQKTACRLLCLAVSEESLAALSDATCNLAENFRFAPYDTAVIPGEMRSSVLLRNIVVKLDALKDEEIKLGTELYEKSLFTTFLVLYPERPGAPVPSEENADLG